MIINQLLLFTDILEEVQHKQLFKEFQITSCFYVYNCMNLGLVMSLSFLSLSQDDEDNKNKIRDAIEESQKGIYLVNDVISCNDELSDDDDL